MLGKKKITIDAVLDTDIESILKQTKQYEAFINGEFHCQNCGITITSQNIGIIQPINTKTEMELTFYCERIDCIEKYHSTNGK